MNPLVELRKLKLSHIFLQLYVYVKCHNESFGFSITHFNLCNKGYAFESRTSKEVQKLLFYC